MRKKLFFSTMFLLATATGLQAQTILRVTPTGSGDGSTWGAAANLEQALSGATSGTQIWVQAGTYQPSAMLVVPANVKLYGGFAGTESDPSQRDLSSNITILDGQNQFGVLLLNSGAGLNGFTIRNGNAQTRPHVNGGGVYAEGGTTIENCIITNNRAQLNGGGVFANCDVTIINTTIQNNTAAHGNNTFGNCLVLSSTSTGGAGTGEPCDPCDPCDPAIPCTTPVIATQPSTTAQVRNPGVDFPVLYVAATPTTHSLSYQWYFTRNNTNAGGTLISGARSAFFMPPSTLVDRNDVRYYCVVRNTCGTVNTGLSGLHTVCFSPPAIAEQPSTDEHHKMRNTGDFPQLSVSATGSGLSYQWRKTAFASSPSSDGINVGINSPTYTPTSEVAEDVYYYCVITSPCGNLTSTVSGLHSVCAPPVITAHPATVDTFSNQGVSFAALSVTATGSTLSYQWYSHTENNNSGGTAIDGATGRTYTPSSAIAGTALHYYCVVTNACGTETSNASGLQMVTFQNCNFSAPEWGANPGTVTWGGNANIATQTWPITGTGANAHIRQVWSDAVAVSGCDKTDFVELGIEPYTMDCRRAINGFHGHYFSWCFMKRYEDLLCPAPWRVPSRQDFINLDMALGFNGNNRAGTVNGVTLANQIARYLGSSGSGTATVNGGGTWGGSRFTGYFGAGELFENDRSTYWASEQSNLTTSRRLSILNSVNPQHEEVKGSAGFAVRCVRDN